MQDGPEQLKRRKYQRKASCGIWKAKERTCWPCTYRTGRANSHIALSEWLLLPGITPCTSWQNVHVHWKMDTFPCVFRGIPCWSRIIFVLHSSSVVCPFSFDVIPKQVRESTNQWVFNQKWIWCALLQTCSAQWILPCYKKNACQKSTNRVHCIPD